MNGHSDLMFPAVGSCCSTHRPDRADERPTTTHMHTCTQQKQAQAQQYYIDTPALVGIHACCCPGADGQVQGSIISQ